MAQGRESRDPTDRVEVEGRGTYLLSQPVCGGQGVNPWNANRKKPGLT